MTEEIKKQEEVAKAAVEEKSTELEKLDMETNVSEKDGAKFSQRTKAAGEEEEQEFIETVVRIARVAKVVKGGRRFSFSAISVVGDGNGKVGIGLGKANEVPQAIQKSFENARRDMIEVPIHNDTVPHAIQAKYGAGKVLLKPASAGTGVIAGGTVRAIVEAAGYKNILTKSLGTNNPVNLLRATMVALGDLTTAKEVAELRDRSVQQVLS
jgi:small subunit ribosomal protein S5